MLSTHAPIAVLVSTPHLGVELFPLLVFLVSPLYGSDEEMGAIESLVQPWSLFSTETFEFTRLATVSDHAPTRPSPARLASTVQWASGLTHTTHINRGYFFAWIPPHHFGISTSSLHIVVFQLSSRLKPIGKRLLLDGFCSLLKPIEDLKTLLYLFNSPAGVILTGTFSSFVSLPLERRQRILSAMKDSLNPIRRQAFKAIAPLTFSVFLTVLNDQGMNANWEALRYQLPPTPEQIPRQEALSFININSERSLKADVVVIGSGAGGGVTAALLAEAGYSVIVLEKGSYISPNAMTWKESEAYPLLYEQAGTMTTDDLGINIFAGSCLGGGTTVNWAASIATPDHVVEEWRQSCPNTFGDSFKVALDKVSERLNVNTEYSVHNKANALLSAGLDTMGFDNLPVPRNAHGVIATVVHPDGERFRVFIKSPIVVSSAGAIHTPALLMRSGLKNPNIGKNLYLHPVVPAIGSFEKDVEIWNGVPMSVISKKFMGKHGTIIEVPTAHLGVAASLSSCQWSGSASFKEKLLGIKNFCSFIPILRDKVPGRVKLDKDGRSPKITYKLSNEDWKNILPGLEGSLRCLVAAGAKEVSAPVAVVNESGECWDMSKLFISDGSVLPTAVGVNPMITIYAVAYQIAKSIIAKYPPATPIAYENAN
eukprot:gene6682-7769_t